MRATAAVRTAAAVLAAVLLAAASPGHAAESTSLNLIDGHFNLSAAASFSDEPSDEQLDAAFGGLEDELGDVFSGGSADAVVVVRHAIRVGSSGGVYRVPFGFAGDGAAEKLASVETELQNERDGKASLLERGTYLRALLADQTGAARSIAVITCDDGVVLLQGDKCAKGGGGGGGGGGGSNTGAVVGAVFGVIFGLALLVGGLVWWRRRSQHRRDLEYTLTGDGLLDDSLGGYQPPRHSQGSFADFEDLPPGWIQQVDDHGNIYYYNHVTDVSTWTLPTA